MGTSYFYRGSILKLLGWNFGGSSYERLIKAFNQLLGISITTNAFWDNENKTYKKIGFGVLSNYEFFEKEKAGRKSKFNNQPTLPLGYFRWDDELFKSFQKGNIKTLNTSLYFSLKSYTAKRLYRFVDKKLYKQQSFEIDLFKLAFEKLEMIGESYKHPSKIIQNLKPAMEELKERGIAQSQIKKSKTESGYKVRFTPATKPQVSLGRENNPEIPLKAEDLVNYFHNKIDQKRIHTATDKELQQAQDVLNQYGEEKSKQIIDYSISRAQETNFKMQFLGAILSYITQAVESLKQTEEKQLYSKVQEKEQKKLAQEQTAYREYIKNEIENYKISISNDQYQKEIEEIKKHLFEKYPWIKTQHWEGPIIQSTAEANYKDWLIEQNKIKIFSFEEWKKEREKGPAIAVK